MPKMYLTIEKWNQWYVNTNFDFPLFGNAKYNVNQKSQCHNKIKPKYLCIFLGLFVCKIYNIFSHSGWNSIKLDFLRGMILNHCGT